MFYHYSSYFENLKALQHLNVSHNEIMIPMNIDIFLLGECSSKKTLDTFDLSYNQLRAMSLFNKFFECLKPKTLILRNLLKKDIDFAKL